MTNKLNKLDIVEKQKLTQSLKLSQMMKLSINILEMSVMDLKNFIEKEFSKDIFDKRIHDAVSTGFLKQNKNGSVSPTIKSKIMYVILKPIGELTNSMDTYYEMKKKVEK